MKNIKIEINGKIVKGKKFRTRKAAENYIKKTGLSLVFYSVYEYYVAYIF